MQTSSFNLWPRVILVRVYQGGLCTSLSVMWGQASLLDSFWPASVFSHDGLGKGFADWLLWVVGCPLPLLSLWVIQLATFLSEEIESQSWPENTICSLWRRIRIFKINCSEGSGIRGAGPCVPLARSGILAFLPLCARKQFPEGQGMQTCALLALRSRAGSQSPTSPELGSTVRKEGTVLHSTPACVCLLRVWAQYCQILQFSNQSETLTFMSITGLNIRQLYLKM